MVIAVEKKKLIIPPPLFQIALWKESFFGARAFIRGPGLHSMRFFEEILLGVFLNKLKRSIKRALTNTLFTSATLDYSSLEFLG